MAMGLSGFKGTLPRHLWLKKGEKKKGKALQVALHPGTAWQGKQWPIQNWVLLAESLLLSGSEVWVTGSPEESHLGKAFERLKPFMESKTLIMTLGKTHWPDMISLYQSMDWVLSGDTVSMHIASGTGPKVLALFGASNPRETGPYGTGHFVIETQSKPYPTQLAFDVEHSELKNLSAISVSNLILKGIAPSEGQLRETYWNREFSAQTLQDRHGANADEPKLRFWTITQEPTVVEAHLPPQLAMLSSRLDTALQETHAHALRELDKAELAWASQTGKSLIWEAYRIGIHGISNLNIQAHLKLRRNRLNQAIEEWRHFSSRFIAEPPLQKAQ
jgi:hypothetical protein